jgi:hypothetical protein
MEECFLCAKLEELEIIGSLVDTVVESLNRILENKTKSQVRQLSLKLSFRLGDNATRTLARWIRCGGQNLETLELHDSKFLSEEAIFELCYAISKSTSLRHLVQMGSEIFVECIEHLFANAIQTIKVWFASQATV